MKRLVSTKKKTDDVVRKKKDAKLKSRPLEAALPLQKTSLRRSRLVSSAAAEAAPTENNTGTKHTNSTNSNRPSCTETSKSENAVTPKMKDSDDGIKIVDIDGSDTGDELFEETIEIQAKPSDEDLDPLVSIVSDPTQSMKPVKEDVERELADVQMERDILRQQLLEARAELEVARSTLRNNVLDLEDQLRSLQQSERRQTELKENALLEEEIDELARLTREQEKIAIKEEGNAAATQRGVDNINLSVECNDGSTVSTEEAVVLSSASSSKSRVKGCETENKKSLSNVHKESVARSENALKESKLKEEVLEKEVRQLKEQAQVQTQKFEEAQRQIKWFQQELKAMFPQEGDSMSKPIIYEVDSEKNETDVVHLETIIESKAERKDEEGKGDCDITSDSNEDDNCSNKCLKESSKVDDVDPSVHVISGNDKLSSSYVNFCPPEGAAQRPSNTALTSSTSNDTSMEELSQSSSKHIKLLHEQRLELEHRLQHLLEEVGNLRLGQNKYQNEKQTSDAKILELQTELQEKQKQHQLELVLVESQLIEWKNRSDLLQTNLEEERNLLESQNARSRLEKQERHKLSQRVEDLELQRDEYKNKLQKNLISFEHEKGYLKRAMQSLEKKVQDKPDSNSEMLITNKEDTIRLEEKELNSTQPAISKQQVSNDEIPETEEKLKQLLDRIQDLEADRETRIESERTLREQLHCITEQEKEAKSQALIAEDRVRVLQTFLDASFSASPERERQLELDQKYFSVHPQSNGKDIDEHEKSQNTTLENKKSAGIAVETESVKTESTKDIEVIDVENQSVRTEGDNNTSTSAVGITTKSESTENIEFIDSENEAGKTEDAQENVETPSIGTTQNISPDSSILTSKLPDTLEQSGNSDDLVHNLHLKLEEEMGNLMKRKERRRSRALSTEPPNDRKAEQSSTRLLPVLPEVDATTKEQQKNEIAETQDELRMKIEEENSRLKTALETINYNKAQLEIKFEDSIKQINDFTNQIDELNTDIKESRFALKESEKEQSDLIEKIETIRNEKAVLEKKLSENKEEKKTYEGTISKLRKDLDAKNEISLENDQSYRKKLEEMTQAVNESQKAIECNQISTEQIKDLQAKIIRVETESKGTIELLTKKLDTAHEERNALELRFRDTSRQSDESKQKDLLLETTVQNSTEKLEAAQDELRNLTRQKEEEDSKFTKIITEKNQLIDGLEKDISCNERRLEQASLQLSELESELFESGKEIERLDAKLQQVQDNSSKRLEQASLQMSDLECELTERDKEIESLGIKCQEIQDNASKRLEQASLQLSEFENELSERDKEIERLNAKQKESNEVDEPEYEKSKLDDVMKRYEQQIEKQMSRLAEASQQLSELESELFAKDDEIEEMELRINAMQALEVQRLESLQAAEGENKQLQEKYDSTIETIQSLTSQVEEMKQEKKIEQAEAQRLMVENDQKNKELLSRQNQLDRQLQNVSKLTEQTDKWQLQLEKSQDDKQELLKRVSEIVRDKTSLRKQLEESNQKIEELKSTNSQLQDDLVCATEEVERKSQRIFQIEEQKEALSQKLESAIDNLEDVQKQHEEDE